MGKKKKVAGKDVADNLVYGIAAAAEFAIGHGIDRYHFMGLIVSVAGEAFDKFSGTSGSAKDRRRRRRPAR